MTRLGQDHIFFEDDPNDEAFSHDEDDRQEAYDEDWEDWEEDVMFEDEIPEEVAEAADSVEDAYVNYVEAA